MDARTLKDAAGIGAGAASSPSATPIVSEAAPQWLGLLRPSPANVRILRAMLTVAVASGLVKLVAIGKEMAIAARFGAGDQIDAFVIACLLPVFVISVVSTAFQAAVIPTYVQVREQDGPAAARELVSNVTFWSCVLLLALAVVLALASPFTLPMIASKFGPEKLWLTRTLFIALLPLVLLTGFTAIWGAALNAEEHFVFVSVTPIVTPLAIVLVLSGALGPVGIGALPAAMVVGALIEAGVLVARGRRHGLGVVPRRGRVHPATRTVMKQFVTMAGGAILMSSTGVVDLSMAAMLGPGSVATLNYANRLVLFIVGFGSAAMSTVLLPHFSAMVARQDWAAVRDTLRTYLYWLALATIPSTALLMWLSVPLARLMFERGAFGPDTTLVVGGIQALYLIQIPFYLMGILLVRLISSLKANHLLLWGSAISVVVNVGLNYAFMKWLGVSGIALSTSLVYVVSFCFLSSVLTRRLRSAVAAGA